MLVTHSLLKNVRQCSGQLHQGGFVHGDIRDTNIMVKTLAQGGFGDGSFLPRDFDWAKRTKKCIPASTQN